MTTIYPEDFTIDHPKSGGLILSIDGHELQMDGDTAEALGVALIKASVNADGSDE